MRDILSDLGYRTDTARNGAEAIEKVDRAAFDVVLLDLKMPGMDGVAAYTEIKHLRPETVAIVVSAFSGSELAEAALEEGAAQVLGKPVDVPVLLAAIESFLAQPLVLLVDDDDDFCKNLWQILNKQGYRLALAHSVLEARRQLAAKLFDVVIVDFKLSDTETAEDVLHAVGASNPTARCILVTGLRDEVVKTVNGFLRGGVDAVCYKPIDVNQLVNLLRG